MTGGGGERGQAKKRLKQSHACRTTGQQANKVPHHVIFVSLGEGTYVHEVKRNHKPEVHS